MNTTEISACFRMLGALFYYSPENQNVQIFLHLLHENQLANTWFFGESNDLNHIQVLMKKDLKINEEEKINNPQFDLSQLKSTYQSLFIGPHHLEAPPWGSVYLDEEGSLFGDSTLHLQDFLKSVHIKLKLENNEPEDHIGLIFLAMSLLAEQNHISAVQTMLNIHLKPWVYIYLNRLEKASLIEKSNFYEGLIQLTRLSLNTLFSDFSK